VYDDSLHTHIAAVEHLADHGIPAPADWQALRDRWQSAAEGHDGGAQAALNTAIVTGDTKADLPVLTALALAEAQATPVHRATVRNALAAAIYPRLCELYATVAVKNYTTAAQRFDKAAQRFTKAAEIVDPEADPTSMVTADDRTRKAWTDALIAARELDAAEPVLAVAAELCGTPTGAPEQRLPLTIDPGTAHRRRLWEAFDSTGRCGRWPALHRLGATIRALPDPGTLEPYRRPLPLEVRQERVKGPYVGIRQVTVDPCDAEHISVISSSARAVVAGQP